ncbi:MAG: AarF/ABC1/UbiB kinase family protein [Rubrobacter sp.]|nr:AarF/ABC1/UbiB kinase family protein [Rubrobacter sp.]
MERNGMARLYADIAKNLFQSLAGAASVWDNETRAAEEIMTRATRHSGEEMEAVFTADETTTGAAFLARIGDLTRAQAFLWASAGLAAGERLGRAASAGATLPGSVDLAAFGWAPRASVLGAVAADLWLGYAALRERARWMPNLVGDEDWELQHRRGAGRVLDAAAALGGTLIKAAQFASTRPDLLPASYTEILSELQDRVPPQPWPVIEGAVAREIDGPLSGVFQAFSREPIAAASIAQVHRARLKDGRTVAVKVQYPGIKSLIEADLAALESIFREISRLEPSVRLQPILDYLRWTLPMELDFRREAEAIARLKNTMSHRDDIVIPEVVEGPGNERLLLMEFVDGIKVTDRERLLAAGIDPRRLAELIVDVYAEQLFRHGVFHADPHPGNLLVQPGSGGPVLVLLDHGITVTVPPELVEALREAVEAISAGDFEALTVALKKAGLDLGPDPDLQTLLGLVGVLFASNRDEVTNLGQFGLKLGSSIGRIPNELLLVGRALGLIDGINHQLDPGFDATEVVARYAQSSY